MVRLLCADEGGMIATDCPLKPTIQGRTSSQLGGGCRKERS